MKVIALIVATATGTQTQTPYKPGGSTLMWNFAWDEMQCVHPVQSLITPNLD